MKKRDVARPFMQWGGTKDGEWLGGYPDGLWCGCTDGFVDWFTDEHGLSECLTCGAVITFDEDPPVHCQSNGAVS